MSGMASVAEVTDAEQRAASLVGLIATATAELVELIADMLERRVWVGCGINTPEHWVALRCGLSPPRARRLVAAARALRTLPTVRAAFGAGEITEDHVTEIVRAEVTAHHDDQVATLAREASVTQLRRGLSFLPRDEPAAASVPEAAVERVSVATRPQVQFGFTDDGMWALHARLPSEQGAVVEKALVAGRDAIFRDDVQREAVSWSDALVRLAMAGLDGLDPDTATGHPPGDRYQVVIHVDGTSGASRFHLGPRLDPATRQQLTCDATVRTWIDGAGGAVDLGRRARLVSPKLRLVVEHRDNGCVVPGCGARRWLHVHHLRHWEDGGPTDAANLISLCGAHHRAVHHGGLQVGGAPERPGGLVFTDAQGRPVGHSPPSPPAERPLPVAAEHLDLPPPHYRTRSGGPADWHWLIWRDLPPASGQ